MFENLKIMPIRALAECELKKIGKINTICGKNNSGKSTLLEGIASKQYRVHGIELANEKLEGITKELFENTEGRAPHQINAYSRFITKIFCHKEIWYEKDADEFFKLYRDINARNTEIRLNYHESGLKRIFNSWTSRDLATVIIPPKRNLVLESGFGQFKTEEPSGQTTINCLFYCKNQNLNTDENSFYLKVLESFEYITQGYRFDIVINNEGKLSLRFSNKKGNWVDAQNCGLGLQDVLIIVYFGLSKNYNVLLIEEPEVHVHPEMQRKLLYFLRNETDKQFFISTHSNVFLDNAFIDRVYYTKFDNGIGVSDETSRAFLLDDLGYSVADNLVSDLVILTEGPTDIPFIEEFLGKIKLLEKYNIKIWPLGGDIMDQLDLSVFAEKYKIIAIVDKDPNSEKIRKKFVKKCREIGVPVTHLQRYSIENYFSIRVLREVFGPQIPNQITEIDPNLKLESQIRINVKKNNRKLARLMTLEEIEGTDIFKFFQKVEKLCTETKA